MIENNYFILNKDDNLNNNHKNIIYNIDNNIFNYINKGNYYPDILLLLVKRVFLNN